jgi:hypothetical protein
MWWRLIGSALEHAVKQIGAELTVQLFIEQGRRRRGECLAGDVLGTPRPWPGG